MSNVGIIAHAELFANHLEANVSVIHRILRRCQSKGVVDDEIQRSVEALRSIREIVTYFTEMPLSHETVAFLPLNLPLYSFILFAVMPAYQSMSLIVRAPQIMRDVSVEMFDALSIGEFYPNIRVFSGTRENFLDQHCKTASVILFTGKYENLLRIRKACSKDALILFNGVGNNPLVITPSADVELAVEKTLQVKLFNNGQDCAGPDILLVHSSIVDVYIEKLVEKLARIRCDVSYQHDDVVVGPLFESSSLLETVGLITTMRRKGAAIVHGGQIDINHNVMYPCVMRTSLNEMQNFAELYSPLFLVTEYGHDRELSLYFHRPNGDYRNREMYISLFGESDYIKGVSGSIILRNRTIHDVERGTEEYGGYSQGASMVSYQGMHIAKPLLIPREIYNFLSPRAQQMFMVTPKTKNGATGREVVIKQFQDVTQCIFGEQLRFAYIFGSFAIEKDKPHSDVDTLICVDSKQTEQIDAYLTWLFSMHEMFGRIPDFKYPTEIVSFADLKTAMIRLLTMELSATLNEAEKYDAMVWGHCLSQPWVGTVNPHAIPVQWKDIFPDHSSRLLRSFLGNLERDISTGANTTKLRPEIYEIPRKDPELSRYIENLSKRGLVGVLKMIPFEETPVYSETVLRLVSEREFMGRSLFVNDSTEHLYHPHFRFGVV